MKNKTPFTPNVIKTYAYFNKSTHIVYEAGKCCYKGKLSEDYDKMLQFVSERINVGHESIIEHTNFFIAAFVPDKYLDQLVQFLECCKYLNTRTQRINDIGKRKFLSKNKSKGTLVNISGSIRGWKHVYRTIEDLNNIILKNITNQIYMNIPMEYFVDLIKDGVIKERKFCYINEEFTEEIAGKLEFEEDNTIDTEDHNYKTIPKYNQDYLTEFFKDYPHDKINIINIDTYRDLVVSGIPDYYIIKNSVPDMLTITVDFMNLARYSTHQLVRHRNGITQESQRYVDYSKMPINNPVQYNPEYDPNKKYKLHSSPFIKFPEEGLTADELCQALQPIYGDLKSQGMRPEEARGYAPFATACGHLYMTFTYRTLAKFLELRTDNHAQGELREWAKVLHTYISQIEDIKYIFNSPENPNVLSNLLLVPRYMQNLKDNNEFPELDEEID